MPCVDRPQVAFRVGVSGPVSVEATELRRVRAQALHALKGIYAAVLHCAETEAARRVYEPKPPVLRLVTPLADGADRLLAAEALKCDRFELEVPLPFEQMAYEATFVQHSPEQHAASVEEFRLLLAAAGARVLTLDGDSLNDIDRPRSYEAVGRLVVRNSDLLVAIWDDQKVSRGRGGTMDTVLYALGLGVPVWWIHATKDLAPKWLEDVLDLSRIGADPDEAMRAYVAKAVLPPDPAKPKLEGAWERIIAYLRRIARIETDPLLAFLNENGLPNRKYWNLHPYFIRYLRAQGGRRHGRCTLLCTGSETAARPPSVPRGREPKEEVSKPLGDKVWQILHLLGEPFRRNQLSQASSVAAGLSGVYQHRYRSSYTLVFACGALALISAVIGAVFDASEVVATFSELLMLGIILWLVSANQLLRWHERYISYRMLGELLRMSQHLHGLGWSLPASRVSNIAHSARRNWVAWFFAASVRATALATGHFSVNKLAEMKRDIIENLIGGQLHFHDRRRTECNGAAHILGDLGRGFFFLTLVFALIRIVLLLTHSGDELVPWLSLFCALLPAASAAFFGIRSYEELGELAEESDQMHEALSRAQTRIGRIDVEQPLASQLLGAELFDVTEIMLSEVAGWAQLFRTKAVEA